MLVPCDRRSQVAQFYTARQIQPQKTQARRMSGRRKSRHGERFVLLPHYLLKSAAFKSLTGDAVKVMLDVWLRHNGINNGEISYGVREAYGGPEAEKIDIKKNAASRALNMLVDHGFLVRMRDSSFNVKTRTARTWRLTAEPYRGDRGTKDFMKWAPPKEVQVATPSNSKHSPANGTYSPATGTVGNNITGFSPPSGTVEAPNSSPQSRQGDTYIIPSPPSQADGTPLLERTGEAKTIDTNFKRAAADVPPEGERVGAVVESREPTGGLETVRDRVAYDDAIANTKWNGWLDRLARHEMAKFDTRTSMPRLEAIEEARRAGSRKATPAHIRQFLNEIDKDVRKTQPPYPVKAGSRRR